MTYYQANEREQTRQIGGMYVIMVPTIYVCQADQTPRPQRKHAYKSSHKSQRRNFFLFTMLITEQRRQYKLLLQEAELAYLVSFEKGRVANTVWRHQTPFAATMKNINQNSNIRQKRYVPTSNISYKTPPKHHK